MASLLISTLISWTRANVALATTIFKNLLKTLTMQTTSFNVTVKKWGEKHRHMDWQWSPGFYMQQRKYSTILMCISKIENSPLALPAKVMLASQLVSLQHSYLWYESKQKIAPWKYVVLWGDPHGASSSQWVPKTVVLESFCHPWYIHAMTARTEHQFCIIFHITLYTLF